MQIENPNGDETLRIQPEVEGKKDDEKNSQGPTVKQDEEPDEKPVVAAEE